MHVWVLPFLLLLPVLAWMRFRMQRSLKSAVTVTTSEAFRVRTARNFLVHLPFWCRLLAIGCLLLALARPRTGNTQEQRKGEGIDIVLAMDISGSMLSTDFRPNRLAVAKAMAEDFVKARPVDQIGLVVFEGESFTQYPLSTDHSGLLEQIRGLKSGLLVSGTVIGEGLATSVDRLSRSKARSKVVILLTDGKEEPPETRLVDPYTALEIAKAKGVKVYTIGMGAEGSAVASERGVRTRTTQEGFLDEALLRRIALQTGGEYFRATNEEGLQLIYERIDRLEKTEVEVTTRTRYEEHFIYFLFAALGFLVLEFILKYTYFRTFP
ncbi:MAG TPA: VWA domain-containing protein [Chitinophagaceae bacterium]|nr:VWA domain-containing protein [Chitinophagaceae bacterium]